MYAERQRGGLKDLENGVSPIFNYLGYTFSFRILGVQKWEVWIPTKYRRCVYRKVLMEVVLKQSRDTVGDWDYVLLFWMQLLFVALMPRSSFVPEKY